MKYLIPAFLFGISFLYLNIYNKSKSYSDNYIADLAMTYFLTAWVSFFIAVFYV